MSPRVSSTAGLKYRIALWCSAGSAFVALGFVAFAQTLEWLAPQ